MNWTVLCIILIQNISAMAMLVRRFDFELAAGAPPVSANWKNHKLKNKMEGSSPLAHLCENIENIS
jgi:hypothetical protein